MIEIYKFGPVPLTFSTSFKRAYLEIYNINTFRPTISCLVFLNDPDVNVENYSASRPSYAGQFAIFGHSECVGDEGHCQITTLRRRFDTRPSHPLTPAFRRVDITETLLNAYNSSMDPLLVSIVAGCIDEKYESGKLLEISGIQVTTFA